MLVQRHRHLFERFVHAAVEFDFVIKGAEDIGYSTLNF
jgi:hypothetical protein